MQIKRLPAARGLVWIWQGFNLFKHNPTIWLILSSANFVLLTVLEQLGGMGGLLTILISPVLLAGWLIGCHQLAQDQALTINHGWAGFQRNTPQLISLGGMILLVLIVTAILITNLGGETLKNIMENWQPGDDPETLMALLGDDGAGLLLELLLVISIPLILLGITMQFSPMLIVFRDVHLLPALKISIIAFTNNLAALTLYSFGWGLLYFTLMILPSTLHPVVVIILSPIIVASTYAAYRDVFPDQTAPVQSPP